jgi:hypothetical protein
MLETTQGKANKYKGSKSTKDTGFISWFSSPQRLVYVHVVEVSHKGFGISFNPILPHTYCQGNRWSVHYFLFAITNFLELPHNDRELPSDL